MPGEPELSGAVVVVVEPGSEVVVVVEVGRLATGGVTGYT